MNRLKNQKISIGAVLLWAFVYFCVMMLYTFIDIMFWRKMPSQVSEWLNVLTIIICSSIYVMILIRRWNLNIKEMLNVDWKSIMLAIGCACLLYILLDNFIDPIIEKLFPASEANYQENISGLKENLITSFIQVCVIAPVVEELLMRGFVLDTLKDKYHVAVALLVSTVLFALLHFNMVQTLSALVSGFILGVLYLKTKSLTSSILAHALYNLMSFCALIFFT